MLSVLYCSKYHFITSFLHSTLLFYQIEESYSKARNRSNSKIMQYLMWNYEVHNILLFRSEKTLLEKSWQSLKNGLVHTQISLVLQKLPCLMYPWVPFPQTAPIFLHPITASFFMVGPNCNFMQHPFLFKNLGPTLSNA